MPLMQDPRFEVDTLFLVFEEDMRFEPENPVDLPPAHVAMTEIREVRAEGEPPGVFRPDFSNA